MSQKRERSINFTREESDTLITLVEEFKDIIESKKSDALTWQEKSRCWSEIEAAFNSIHTTYRTAKTLKFKYEGIKRETKKKLSQLNSDSHNSGGGPSTLPNLTPAEEKFRRKILFSIDGGLVNTYDSDYVENSTDADQPTPKVKNITHWSTFKSSYLKSKNPALYKSIPKRPFERAVKLKIEITELQKQILEEENEVKRKQWDFEEQQRKQIQKRWEFEEEERAHKKEIWALEKKLLEKKLQKC